MLAKLALIFVNLFNFRPLDQDDDEDSFDGLSEDSDTAHLKPRRQYWANKMQFVLACIGYSVGNSHYKLNSDYHLVQFFLHCIVFMYLLSSESNKN